MDAAYDMASAHFAGPPAEEPAAAPPQPASTRRKRLRRITSADAENVFEFQASLNRLCGAPVCPGHDGPGLRRDFVAACRSYFTEPGAEVDTDPLEWWASKGHALLAPLARQLLCLPGSSARVARTFSGGRRLLSARRGRLDPHEAGNPLKLKASMALLGMWSPTSKDEPSSSEDEAPPELDLSSL